MGNSIVKSVKLALGEQCTEEDEEVWKTVIGALMSAFAEFSSKWIPNKTLGCTCVLHFRLLTKYQRMEYISIINM